MARLQETGITELVGLTQEQVFSRFGTSIKGLSDEEAEQRLQEYGFNELFKPKKRSIVFQIASKFLNPLVIVLLIIAIFSIVFGEIASAILVILMAIGSVSLSFFQEHRAGKEAEKLSEMVRPTATVYRNGITKEIPIREIVPGDIVYLSAGDMVPADLRIVSCKDLFVNQASLTGESFPVEKTAAPVITTNHQPSELKNIAFMGSSIVSGTGLGVVIKTGLATQFGMVSYKLATMTEETNFERGVRSFTWLMIRFMLVLVVIIFFINAMTKGDFLQSFLFALAVSVGLTPEMLPMLVAINLSKGAIAMSRKDVIVKRLSSIQNFGAMDVLCTDKTGTLTLDEIILEIYCDVTREESEEVLYLAYINSCYQTGLKNILDRAVLKYKELQVEQYKKIDEIPFDFSRKMMSVVVEIEGKHRLITKGAPEEVFKKCVKYELDGELFDIDPLVLTDLKLEYEHLSAQGFRVLAIAYRDYEIPKEAYTKNDEVEMVLKGYVAFLDPPKPTAKETIEALRKRGIELKVLTGDNELVTRHICNEVGLDVRNMLTGEHVETMGDNELVDAVKSVTVFSRLSPLQKERIIRALHKNNHTVGYLGDGINDALALKA
ncbi:MAG TPA: magnesium-translocating P-type ATPase, partial [bacterium]|nr:magnesium-translocating P-type ATPase [bacterium]